MNEKNDEDDTQIKSRKNTVRYQDENGNKLTDEKFEELRNAKTNFEKQKLIEENKKNLYYAVIFGDLNQVEELLERPESDINMTYYSESLLMCAIRNKQEKMAEYLIAKGIDVSYEVELFEFPEGADSKLAYKFYSCRQMAYDYEMTNIVNLIDFFDKKTSNRVAKYIGENLLHMPKKKNDRSVSAATSWTSMTSARKDEKKNTDKRNDFDFSDAGSKIEVYEDFEEIKEEDEEDYVEENEEDDANEEKDEDEKNEEQTKLSGSSKREENVDKKSDERNSNGEDADNPEDNDEEYHEEGDDYYEEEDEEYLEGDAEEQEEEAEGENEKKSEEKKVDDNEIKILEDSDDDDDEENMGIFKSVSKIQIMEAEERMQNLLYERLNDCITKRLHEIVKPVKLLEERLTHKELSYKGYKINLKIQNENYNEENDARKSKSLLSGRKKSLGNRVSVSQPSSKRASPVKSKPTTPFESPSIQRFNLMSIMKHEGKVRPHTCKFPSINLKDRNWKSKEIDNNSRSISAYVSRPERCDVSTGIQRGKSSRIVSSYLSSLKRGGLSNNYCTPIIRAKSHSGNINSSSFYIKNY